MTVESCNFPNPHQPDKWALFCRNKKVCLQWYKRHINSRLLAGVKHLKFSGVYHQWKVSEKVKIKGSRKKEGHSEECLIVE